MAIVSRGPDVKSIIPFNVMDVNLNATGDQAVFTGIPPNTTYVVDTMEVWGFTAQPGLVLAFSLRDKPAGSGGILTLLSSGAGLNLVVGGVGDTLRIAPIGATLGANKIMTATTLYFNVSIANVTTLRANVTLFLRKLSI